MGAHPVGVTTERLPRSLVALEIEVENDRLEASMEKASRRLSQRVKIPGFRPGKAPRPIVERTLGRPALVQEALELLLPDVYSEVIAEQKIDAIGQPSFDLKSTEPLIVSATVPVRPTIDLKEYATTLRAPRAAVEVTPERMEEAIDSLRRRFATLDPVDRPIAWGDTVRTDVVVSVDGQDEPHTEEGAEFAVIEGSTVSLPGFLDHLIGLERGGPYAIEFALPEDFAAAELAGKTAHYTVTVHEVKQEILPELDDDFVRSLDEEGIETVAQLRERMEQTVRAQDEAAAETAYQEEVLDLLLASSELDYPELLVEREVDRMLDQQSDHASHTPEQLAVWLQQIGRTEEEVREGFQPRADLAVRRALVLGELAQREAVTVDEAEIEAEIDRMMDQFGGAARGEMPEEQRSAFRQMFDTPDYRSSIHSQLMTTATLGRLVEIASQSEADGDGTQARGSRRRRGTGTPVAEAGGEGAEGTEEVASETTGAAETSSTDAQTE